MATVNLGSIKFKWKGTYSGATAYTIDDVVEYNGSSYICKLASTGNLPTNTTYFDQMSAKGTDGTNGTDGTDLTTTLTTQGDIVYRDASGLARLGAGSAGQLLQSGGTGANVSWTDAPAGNTSFNDNYVQFEVTPGQSGVFGWQTLPLNSMTSNLTGASLSSNLITLPAGTYCVMGGVHLKDTSSTGVIFARNSDDQTLGTGMDSYRSGGTQTNFNGMFDHFTLNVSTVCKFRYYAENSTPSTPATYAIGSAGSFIFWKL